MNGYLEANLKCLEGRDPLLKERLKWPAPDECDLEVVREGRAPSLRRRAADGEWRLLHSIRDPEKESHRWVDGKIRGEPVYNVIVLGAGLWYHIWSLVYRLQSTLENLVIIEQSDAVLRTAFQLRDLRPILANEHTYVLANATAEEIRRVMNRLLTTFTLNEVLVVEHEPSVACSPEFYAQARRTVEECLESGRILLRTKVQMGGLIQENLYRNLPKLFSTPRAALLGGVLEGLPAVIVAAGPSLDRNREQLRTVDNRAAIICVDTSYPILRREGILPHLSVTADPSPYNLAHFTDFPDMGETVLLYAPSVYWEVLAKVQAKMASLPLPFSRTLGLLPGVGGEAPYIKPGLNVAQSALNLAVYMGCDPIIFVGLDLSFEPSGGGTHATGAALRRKIMPSCVPGRMVVELLGGGTPTEEFEPVYVPANTGGQVPTSKFWLSYLRSIEQDVATCPARCINATEGGARIEGTQIMTLSQALLENLSPEQIDITDRLHMVLSSFIPLDPSDLKAFWENAEQVLTVGREKAGEGRALLGEVESWLATGDCPAAEIQRLAEKITAVHRDLIQDQKIYAYLDEAADCVLSEFLKKKSRPQKDVSDLGSLRKTVERYRPFFQGMEEICSRFLTIVHETSPQTPQAEGFDFGEPIIL